MLGVLNKGFIDIPKNMPYRPPENRGPGIKESKKDIVSPININSQPRQNAGWPEQAMRQSYQRNSKKYGSDIFKSIWKCARLLQKCVHRMYFA